MAAISVDFTQLSANGSTASQSVPVGGKYSFYGYGTFGGGTLTFEASFDGTNWFSLGAGLTANGRQSYDLIAGEYLRATLSGATTPTVDVSVR